MLQHGVEKKGNQTTFSVWAPFQEQITLHLIHPKDQELAMEPTAGGYWQLTLTDMPADTTYYYQFNGGTDYPDPASHYQPEGVHGPSQVIDHAAFNWTDADWQGIPLQHMILYELHVGTFTPEGTFEAIIDRLPDLKATGINAIELMPVNQFPGNRNWGYDGVYLYGVQNSYGGPNGLKKLVDACHRQGIAVILDVVYNHLGPEGNYIDKYGPYFTDKYLSPWGQGINFDDAHSDAVRAFFADNAVYWFQQYHIDGLRCDAVHTVFDNTATHFWELLHHKVKALEQTLQRPLWLMAESDLNSPKVVQSPEQGGQGFDAQWLDDFHHSLYVLIDEAGKDRYYDFGSIQQLAKAYTDGFVHSGEWVQFRKRRHGISSKGTPGHQFIAFNHNHDQVGNRVQGERLSILVDHGKLRLAAAALFLSPYIPMLFMGEEYGEEAPFFYFVSHSDKTLIEEVRQGRRKQFEDFLRGDEDFPDPQEEATFQQSKLHWQLRNEGKYKLLLNWHKALINLRQTSSILKYTEKEHVTVDIINEKALAIHRQGATAQELLTGLFNFSNDAATYTLPGDALQWHLVLDSTHPQWDHDITESTVQPMPVEGHTSIQLPPWSAVVYTTIEQAS